MSTRRLVLVTGATGYVGGRLLYWYALLPLHRLVFAGMLDGVARRAAAPAEAAR